MAMRIEDYALIGDRRTAALVARDGSIDWLCVPRFDSGACFAALVGTEDHGRWKLSPAGAVDLGRVRRRYRPGSLVLETEFTTASGVVRLTDAMALGTPNPCVVRVVEGLRGEVPMRMELAIRFDYGSIVPWVRRLDGGVFAIAGPDTLQLVTPVETHGEGYKSVAEFTVSAGQKVPFSLMWQASHEPPPAGIDVLEAIEAADVWWREWSGRCRHDWAHGHDGAAIRSLITLKALTYAPTGGIVAAPTTSLPEKIGGVRNWDYRFCWLRDATFSLIALIEAGYLDEARDWREWLLRAVAGKPEELQIMYGLAGERRLTEMEMPWLPGYEGSRPVRAGNAASGQFQIDVYGEVAHALSEAHKSGLATLDDSWQMGQTIYNFLETAWDQPDEGIWEVRGGRKNFTHSKVMAWVAFDRVVKAVEGYGMTPNKPDSLGRWKAARDAIHAKVCAEGFDASQNAFVQSFGSELLDASLLMIPLVGFLPATDPRVVGTIEAIAKRLDNRGFIRRYEMDASVDGLPPGEGVFLPCTFWLADCLHKLGRTGEASDLYDQLLSVRNDVGLFAEEYDPVAKRLLGNFPQAFTHVCQVNSARNLEAR